MMAKKLKLQRDPTGMHLARSYRDALLFALIFSPRFEASKCNSTSKIVVVARNIKGNKF